MKTKPFSELTSVYISLATLTVWDSNQASLAFFFFDKDDQERKGQEMVFSFPTSDVVCSLPTNIEAEMMIWIEIKFVLGFKYFICCNYFRTPVQLQNGLRPQKKEVIEDQNI